MNMNGFKVVVSALVNDVPKIEVRPSFQWITDVYREKLNAELLEMFGTNEHAIVDNLNRVIYVNESAFSKLKLSSKGGNQ